MDNDDEDKYVNRNVDIIKMYTQVKPPHVNLNLFLFEDVSCFPESLQNVGWKILKMFEILLVSI